MQARTTSELELLPFSAFNMWARSLLLGLFAPLRLAQTHPRAAVVLVDEFDAGTVRVPPLPFRLFGLLRLRTKSLGSFCQNGGAGLYSSPTTQRVRKRRLPNSLLTGKFTGISQFWVRLRLSGRHSSNDSADLERNSLLKRNREFLQRNRDFGPGSKPEKR